MQMCSTEKNVQRVRYLIYGCGGHSRSVCNVLLEIEEENPEIVFIDDNARDDEKIWGFPVVMPDRIKKEEKAEVKPAAKNTIFCENMVQHIKVRL